MMIWTCGFIRRNGVCRTCVYIYFFSLPSLCSICHYINTLVKWFYFMFVKVLINVPIRFVCSSPHFLYSIFTESINGIGFVFFLCRGIEIDIAYFSLRYTIGTSQFCCRCTIQNEPSIFPGETIFFLTSKIFVLFIVVVISLYGVWYGEVDSLLCISTEREIELFSAEKPLNT